METRLSPVVNGCYLDENSEMFKVKMLGYLEDRIHYIIIEDTSGKVTSVNYNNWKNMRLTPCCISSHSLQKQSVFPA